MEVLSDATIWTKVLKRKKFCDKFFWRNSGNSSFEKHIIKNTLGIIHSQLI